MRASAWWSSTPAHQASTLEIVLGAESLEDMRLAERERLLATVQAEVRRLEAAERARQAELERR
ncbi:MAG: hypothetical protein ACRDNX_14725, partial [Gaiellaceae bacterium]